MKTTKISFYELMEDMDEDFWDAVSSPAAPGTAPARHERIRFRKAASVPVRKLQVRKRILTALFPVRSQRMRAYRLAGFFLALAMASSVTVYSLSNMVTKNTRIDGSNRHLIGSW